MSRPRTTPLGQAKDYNELREEHGINPEENGVWRAPPTVRAPAYQPQGQEHDRPTKTKNEGRKIVSLRRGDNQHRVLSYMADKSEQLPKTLGFLVRNIPDHVVPRDLRERALAGLDGLAEYSARVSQMAREAVDRTKHQGKIRAMTDTPNFGNKTQMPQTNTYHLAFFSGLQAEDCLDFLRRLVRVCQDFGLAEETSIWMMERHTVGIASEVVQGAIRDDCDFQALMGVLEVNFAHHTSPAEARLECDNIRKSASENYTELSMRIRKAAFLAAREEPCPREEELSLARRVFQMNLEPTIKQQAEQLDEVLVLGGGSPMSYTSMVCYAETIRQKRQPPMEKADRVRQIGATGGNGNHAGTRRLEEPGREHQGAAVRDQGRRQRGNNDPSPSFNLTNSGQSWRPQDRPKQEYQSNQEAPRWPRPKKIKKKRVDIKTLNVAADACEKCGQFSHWAKGPTSYKCPLRQERLTEVCPLCHTGGHLPEMCPNQWQMQN